MTLTARNIDSPIGTLTIVVSDDGVRALLMSTESPDRIALGEEVAVGEHPLLDAAADQLGEYFAGSPHGLRPAARPARHRLPAAGVAGAAHHPLRGDGQLRRAGAPARRREQGPRRRRCERQEPDQHHRACHRVIGADGSLTGFGGGVETKAWLLAHERGASTLW